MEKKTKSIERLFGLIGYPLSHSFSKKYFTRKFKDKSISECTYELFPLEKIALLPDLIKNNSNLAGLNVTIPYKQGVIPFLDDLDEAARAVGAVNTITFKEGQLKGYNTDIYGFEKSLLKLISSGNSKPNHALILGTGGAAQAVIYVLNKLNISFQLVSRTPGKDVIIYDQLGEKIIRNHQLIINTTPLGMSPNISKLPPIPYPPVGPEHFLFDLVYNPEETAFLRKGKIAGATVSNGLEMLFLQAEKAWEIWNA